jgi:hypothetical protein
MTVQCLGLGPNCRTLVSADSPSLYVIAPEYPESKEAEFTWPKPEIRWTSGTGPLASDSEAQSLKLSDFRGELEPLTARIYSRLTPITARPGGPAAGFGPDRGPA